MEKVLVFVILITFLFVVPGQALAGDVVVGTAPGVPACQELNDRMDWQTQSYLYHSCEVYGVDYALAIAVIEVESEFNPKAYNGCDRGLMQVNNEWVSRFKKKGWISSKDELYDPRKNIQCGMYILGDAVQMYGNTEKAYCFHNTGKGYNHTKASRKVMAAWEKWKALLEPEETEETVETVETAEVGVETVPDGVVEVKEVMK